MAGLRCSASHQRRLRSARLRQGGGANCAQPMALTAADDGARRARRRQARQVRPRPGPPQAGRGDPVGRVGTSSLDRARLLAAADRVRVGFVLPRGQHGRHQARARSDRHVLCVVHHHKPAPPDPELLGARLRGRRRRARPPRLEGCHRGKVGAISALFLGEKLRDLQRRRAPPDPDPPRCSSCRPAVGRPMRRRSRGWRTRRALRTERARTTSRCMHSPGAGCHSARRPRARASSWCAFVRRSVGATRVAESRALHGRLRSSAESSLSTRRFARKRRSRQAWPRRGSCTMARRQVRRWGRELEAQHQRRPRPRRREELQGQERPSESSARSPGRANYENLPALKLAAVIAAGRPYTM